MPTNRTRSASRLVILKEFSSLASEFLNFLALKIKIRTMIIMIDRIRLNMPSSIFVAVIAPNTVPGIAGRAKNRQKPILPYPLRLNVKTPTRLCMPTASRLVPFAVTLSRPKKISRGSVKRDPPPAKTLHIPAAIPAINKKNR